MLPMTPNHRCIATGSRVSITQRIDPEVQRTSNTVPEGQCTMDNNIWTISDKYWFRIISQREKKR